MRYVNLAKHARKSGWNEYEIYEGRNSQIKYKVNDNELVKYFEEHRQKLVDALEGHRGQ